MPQNTFTSALPTRYPVPNRAPARPAYDIPNGDYRGLPSRTPEHPVVTMNGREYILARNVPILDEHSMPASNGEPSMYCGPRELRAIANNNNRRVRETNDMSPIVIGHTEDGEDEQEQPEIVGYARNFQVGRLLNTDRQALHADFLVEKQKKDLVNRYPRRSVELWPKKWEVDPISLLGATTPERDLGLLQLSRKNEVIRLGRDGEVIHYSRHGHILRYSRETALEDGPVFQYDRWPQSRREKTPRKDFAGPHQSFPIESQHDVDSAARLAGKATDPAAVRGKIRRIAKKKGLTLPESWRSGSDKMARQYAAFKGVSDKPVEGMSAAHINKELDTIAEHSSKLTDEFIESGRGHERPSDYLHPSKTDDLSKRAQALHDRRSKLQIEVSARAGPNMRRLPKGFGPRKMARQYAVDTAAKCGCDDQDCPCCGGSCDVPAALKLHRKDVEDNEGTPMCSGCADDAFQTGLFRRGHRYTHDVERKVRGIPANHDHDQPTKKSYRRPNMLVGYKPPANGKRRYAGEIPQPDDASAAIVEQVLQSAPIQEMIQSNKDMQGQLSELMQVLQSEGGEGEEQPGMGGQPPAGSDMGDEQQGAVPPDGNGAEPDQNARWMDEPHMDASAEGGMPEHYDAMDDEAEQYAMDDEEMDDDENSADVKPGRYDASFASSTGVAIPNVGGRRGMKTRNSRQGQPQRTATTSNARKSYYDLYVEAKERDEQAAATAAPSQYARNDQKLLYARMQKTIDAAEARIRQLEESNLRYERGEDLRTLQLTEGIVMNVEEEIDRTIRYSADEFQSYCDKVLKINYKRDPGAGGFLRLSPTTTPNLGSPATRERPPMDKDQSMKYSRRIADRAVRIRGDNPKLSHEQLIAKAKAEVDGEQAVA